MNKYTEDCQETMGVADFEGSFVRASEFGPVENCVRVNCCGKAVEDIFYHREQRLLSLQCPGCGDVLWIKVGE